MIAQNRGSSLQMTQRPDLRESCSQPLPASQRQKYARAGHVFASRMRRTQKSISSAQTAPATATRSYPACAVAALHSHLFRSPLPSPSLSPRLHLGMMTLKICAAPQSLPNGALAIDCSCWRLSTSAQGCLSPNAYSRRCLQATLESLVAYLS